MSRYTQYSQNVGERFSMRVHTVEVRGIFAKTGMVTGTLLSGTVHSGDTLIWQGKAHKPYTVNAVAMGGNAVRPEVGTMVRLEISGIKKSEMFPGSVLMGSSASGSSNLRDVYQYRGTDSDYFAEVFARYFPDYDIRQNVGIQGTNGEPITVDFLFYQGGTPRLAVFLRYSGEWRKKEVNYLKAVCAAQGMEAMVFIRDFQNTAEYVCNRVEGVLC